VARRRASVLATVLLVVLLATLAVGIVLTQRQSRSRILSNFALRGTTSATFVSTFVSQQSDLSMLRAFVAHTIAYSQHEVFLVDSTGHLIAASPAKRAGTLSAADPALARAVEHRSLGSVPGARTPSTFTSARVAGTPWRLVIAVPDNKLYSSVTGWAQTIPWIVFALVTVLGLALVVLFARLSALSERMAASARTDSLTGLCNRRAVEEHLARAAAYARRHDQPMSVLMIDLDRFKQTNDCHGHAAGDRVLCAVADCMRNALRTEDIPGRWGGDEFIVLLPAADEQEASAVAARLRTVAASCDLADIGLAQGVRMSVGSATATLTSADEIIHAADVALYEEKSKRAPLAPAESTVPA
jgi:diguanylate cyclase (GGDEF)-like protein